MVNRFQCLRSKDCPGVRDLNTLKLNLFSFRGGGGWGEPGDGAAFKMRGKSFVPEGSKIHHALTILANLMKMMLGGKF